eukprot:TRINITY_DN7608_c0_g1_i1.p1 TRINITY_DN7608_c0_g1~~TRINITY_DN7608_c0_g1_i1.p1  ORF type:complete len:417 (+),score=62.33 TRINITY_DN7608_c0_g1_i1:85-1335(+)
MFGVAAVLLSLWLPSLRLCGEQRELSPSINRTEDAFTLPLVWRNRKYLVPLEADNRIHHLVLDVAMTETFFLDCSDGHALSNAYSPSSCLAPSKETTGCTALAYNSFDGVNTAICLNEQKTTITMGGLLYDMAPVFLGRFDRASSSSISGNYIVTYDRAYEGMRFWNQTAGNFGMAIKRYLNQNTEAPSESVFVQMVKWDSPPARRVIEIDLNPAPQQSYLHINKYLSSSGWSFVEYWDYHYSLQVFHLSMCGVDLLSNYSSHWRVAFDSGAECLALPSTFLRMIEAWAPIDCQTGVCYYRKDDHGSTSQDVDHNAIPPLLFQLSENGPQYTLLLGKLFQEDSQTFCIKALDDAKSDIILMGNIPMQQFHIAFDLDENRVGMKPKFSAGSELESSCKLSILVQDLVPNTYSCLFST